MHHPSIELAAHHPSRTAGWSRAVHWWRLALGLIAKAPASMMLLPFLPLAGELLLQRLPGAGVPLSKLTIPVLTAWVVLMIDNKVRLGITQPARALTRLRDRPSSMLGLALLGVLVFALQCLTAWLLSDADTVLALVTGRFDAIDLDRAQLGLVLASGALPSFFLFFVTPRVALAGRSAPMAVLDNLVRLSTWWRPALLTMAVVTAALAALPWQPWLLLVLAPVGCVVGYVAYRDAFDPGIGRVGGT